MRKSEYITTKILKIVEETSKVKTFILDTRVKVQPGQYIMVWIPGENEKPFGVAQPSPLMLSIANVGPFTEKLHHLKEGDKITFRGPYGKGYTLKGKKILLVGGGYGVVPLYCLVFSTPSLKRKNTSIVIGAKTKSDLLFVSKFKKLGCKVYVSTDDGTSGFKGFATQLVEKLFKKEKFDSLYTCGPEIMMKKLAQICNQKHIFCQVSLERFFKCGGFGICGECSIKGHMVCKEGPVFNGKILVD